MLRNATRALGLVLPVGAVVWALLVVAAPRADSLARVVPLARWVAAGTYLVGGVVCHQRPERSFRSDGAQWPVCGRCSGLYLSAAAGVVAAFIARRQRRLPFSAWRALLAVASLPTVLTLLLEWLNPAWSSSLGRALAAVPLGFGVGWLLTASMSFQVD